MFTFGKVNPQSLTLPLDSEHGYLQGLQGDD